VRESGHRLTVAVVLAVVVTVAASVVAWSAVLTGARGAAQTDARAAEAPGSLASGRYSVLASRSIRLLERTYYNGSGLWHMCVPVGICNTKNRDWGADALSNVMYLRWALTGDRTARHYVGLLAQSAHDWVRTDLGSSDNVTWDAVADARMYQATGSKVVLGKAEDALRWVDRNARNLAVGACPTIDYQWPYGARGYLKTIETTTNYVKAALLLYQITRQQKYLAAAEFQYAQVRRYFLARSVPLYSSYMFDTGQSCHVVPGLYFASVNGNMIWAGQALARITGKQSYLNEALATAKAVQTNLSDGAGVFADLQADNDIVGPLVEAMYELATSDHVGFARQWLLANASAAGGDVNPAGEFGRFFDGPAPTLMATAWQVSGGIDLIQAAAALDPRGRPVDPGFWQRAIFVPDRQGLTSNLPNWRARIDAESKKSASRIGAALTGTGTAGTSQSGAAAQPSASPASSPTDPPPASNEVRISFTGRAIAIMGTIGAYCCIPGHAQVYVDGVQTFSHTGIWQDFSSPSRLQPDQVLFAWRWSRSGHHVITILPGIYNSFQGGSFFQMTGYQLVK
jgi:hypothetical protein